MQYGGIQLSMSSSRLQRALQLLSYLSGLLSVDNKMLGTLLGHL